MLPVDGIEMVHLGKWSFMEQHKMRKGDGVGVKLLTCQREERWKIENSDMLSELSTGPLAGGEMHFSGFCSSISTAGAKYCHL